MTFRSSRVIGRGASAATVAVVVLNVLTPRLRTRELPKLVLWAMLGRATRHDAFEIFSATELWVEMPQKRRVLVSTDGEIAVAATPLHYKVMPRALNVIVPPPSP